MNERPPYRRTRAYLSALGMTQIHLRNPWVVAFFAFSFPGFGYLLLERYLMAFTFIGWEVFINNLSKINLGILHTLLGHFDKAKQSMDPAWLMLYVTIYMFNIWDSYRSTVDINKQFLLADRENAPVTPFVVSYWDINFMDKKQPWIALAWSVLAPGAGHLYVRKAVTGIFIFAATLTHMYFSHIPLAIHSTLNGDLAGAKRSLDMQWTLYLPSVYSFIYYDAYISAVEHNKLMEKELAGYLRANFQKPSLRLPLRTG